MVGEFGLQALSFLATPLFTVYLAPGEYGRWALGSMLLGALACLYNPALHGAVTRYYFILDEPSERRRFLGTIQTFLVVWGLGLSIVLMLAGPWLAPHVFGEDLPFWPYGALIVWTGFLGVLGVVPRAVWAAAEMPKALVAVGALGTTAYLGLAVSLVAVAGAGVDGLFWARLASSGIVSLAFLAFARRHTGLAWDRGMLRDALTFSLPLFPHLLALWALALSDRFILSRMLDVGSVGVYMLGYVFLDAANLVTGALNGAWVPQFTRAHGVPSLAPFVARSVTWFMVAVVGVVLAGVVLSPTIVRLLFDERYHAAAPISAILVVGALFQGLYLLGVAVLFFHRRNAAVPVVTTAAALVNVGLNVWWIPKWGLPGAAWATVVGYSVLAAGVWAVARRFGGLPVERGRVAALLTVGTLAGSMGTELDGTYGTWTEVAVKVALLSLSISLLVATALWRRQDRAIVRATPGQPRP
ncbi:oligosaccharide flippase family protein [Myxococcota bacterium]|nr:oligosaccharide flippase family protein [Myxococcota bacterium]